jgi:hypothetical protein
MIVVQFPADFPLPPDIPPEFTRIDRVGHVMTGPVGDLGKKFQVLLGVRTKSKIVQGSANRNDWLVSAC